MYQIKIKSKLDFKVVNTLSYKPVFRYATIYVLKVYMTRNFLLTY